MTGRPPRSPISRLVSRQPPVEARDTVFRVSGNRATGRVIGAIARGASPCLCSAAFRCPSASRENVGIYDLRPKPLIASESTAAPARSSGRVVTSQRNTSSSHWIAQASRNRPAADSSERSALLGGQSRAVGNTTPRAVWLQVAALFVRQRARGSRSSSHGLRRIAWRVEFDVAAHESPADHLDYQPRSCVPCC